jgi:hypothetical protein
VPGGPRGLQNRRRRASGGVGSIPILSGVFLQFLYLFRCAKRARRTSPTGRQLQRSLVKGGESDVT